MFYLYLMNTVTLTFHFFFTGIIVNAFNKNQSTIQAFLINLEDFKN